MSIFFFFFCKTADFGSCHKITVLSNFILFYVYILMISLFMFTKN